MYEDARSWGAGWKAKAERYRESAQAAIQRQRYAEQRETVLLAACREMEMLLHTDFPSAESATDAEAHAKTVLRGALDQYDGR